MSKVIGKSVTPHRPGGENCHPFSPHLSELHIMNQQPISMEYSGLLFGPVQADISVVEIFIIPTMAFAYRVHIFSPKALVKFSGADVYSNQITSTGDRHTLGGKSPHACQSLVCQCCHRIICTLDTNYHTWNYKNALPPNDPLVWNRSSRIFHKYGLPRRDV